MPISSLPSPYGIGTIGPAACRFVDFLAQAGQKYWQILPVGPLSYGDSPYQSLSTFAGNPYFIDLDLLIADGLLNEAEVQGIDWGSDPEAVDYGRLYENRFTVLRKAADRGLARDAEAVAAFAAQNSGWLPDYTLFMALKRHYGMKPWSEWPDEDVRLHRAEACEAKRRELSGDVQFFTYIQYLFFRQWDALRAYANGKGVSIIGDLPIYVAMDSADVWAAPGCFQLDEKNIPVEVAGVPPDVFNADGQLWGNPLYRWDEMQKDGFGWWIRRVDGAFRLYDVLRFDHFRGLESYWAVPYGAASAKEGRWVKGPGAALVDTLSGWFAGKQFIAEDLGYLTPEVKALLARSGFPGMRILEFGFEDGGAPYYMPHNYPRDSVCYTGTHDNQPVLGWKDTFPKADVAMARRYLGLDAREGYHWGFLRGGMSSVSDLFIAQMQDYLGLGKESRTNTPGRTGGNWIWRMKPDAASPALAQKILAMTRLYGRA